jgi:hypothetical protein
MRTSCARKGRSLAVVTMVIALAAPCSRASACAYDQDDVSLERVALGVLYPEALHVLGAISEARVERRLPLPKAAASGPDLFGYQRTVRSLRQLAERLSTLGDPNTPPTFTLVLIEPMLWSRLELGGEPRVQVHVSDAQPGDPVIVTGEDVIEAVGEGRMEIEEAYERGLLRPYGTESQVARQVARLRSAFQRLARRQDGVRSGADR